VLEPWAHGTVARATRYPDYFAFNLVRVEDDPAMSVDALVGVADQALAGLAHRRVDFDLAAAAEPLRAGFEAKGWRATRLVWMRHEAVASPGPDIRVADVPYDAVHALRLAWEREDFPDQEPGRYLAQSREVARRRSPRVLAVCEEGVPVAFAQLERNGAAAEITKVYVHPDFRGRGRGTALTRKAIEAAADARDVWIAADDEGWAKEIYARLGFRAAWTRMHFLRLP
jgi:GNAT superfamily N-acetyltransferase